MLVAQFLLERCAPTYADTDACDSGACHSNTDFVTFGNEYTLAGTNTNAATVSHTDPDTDASADAGGHN